VTGKIEKTKFFHNTKFLLFLACFLVYNLNGREISSGDTLPSRYLPLSIIREFNLNLDEFPGLYENRSDMGYRNSPGYSTPYYIQKINNHYYSNYSVIIPLMAVPVYILPVILRMPVNGATVDMLSKLSASLFASLSVLVLYFTLLRLTKKKTAVFGALSYAFLTSTWSIASQGLWKNCPVELFLTIAIYLLVRGIEDEKYAAYSAIPLGLMTICSQNSIVIAAVLSIYMLYSHRKRFTVFLLILLPLILLQVVYNFYLFGHLLGGEFDLQMNHTVALYRLQGKGVFSAPLLEGIAGLLFNPSRGLIVYSPVLIFAFMGIFTSFREKKDALFRFLGLTVVVFIVYMGKFYAWWGGHCFGPRYFTDIMPILVIFMVFSMDRIKKKGVTRAVLAALVVYSLLVQIMGVFIYPDGWNNILEDDKGFHREYLWKCRDSQLVRCIKRAIKNRQFLLERAKDGIGERKSMQYYALNDDTMDFKKTDSGRFCEYGWSSTEEWGTWALGPESVVLFSLKNRKDRIMIIKASAVRSFGRNQVMGIYINDTLLEEHEFKKYYPAWETIEIKVPGALLKENIEELKFTYKYFKRASLRDSRIIALGFESIRFNETGG